MPLTNSALSLGSLGVRTVAPGAFATSLMSFMVINRSCSRSAPAFTTMNRSADKGVSIDLAISRPSRGW